jgi:replication-associated recombination protein RarA
MNYPATLSKYSSFSEFLRPRTLDELTLPAEKITKLQAMIDSQNVMSMIFYGSPGTGKTTCANIIANSNSFDYIFINASLKNGMKHVRETIEPFTTAMSLYQSKKLVLLDEADRLSLDAQSALRGVIEQSSATCRFILTVNKISKIDPALQSRCMPVCFDMPLQTMPAVISKVTATIESRLTEIDASIDESKLHHFVQLNYPDYRTIANKIQFELL